MLKLLDESQRAKAAPGQLKSLGTDAFVAFTVLFAAVNVNAIEV
jgi:hypothetical protein